MLHGFTLVLEFTGVAVHTAGVQIVHVGVRAGTQKREQTAHPPLKAGIWLKGNTTVCMMNADIFCCSYSGKSLSYSQYCLRNQERSGRESPGFEHRRLTKSLRSPTNDAERDSTRDRCVLVYVGL